MEDMNVDPPIHARPSRSKQILFALFGAFAVFVWWLTRPAYRDFEIPLPESDHAFWTKSYITASDEMDEPENYYIGTRYLVRLEGHAREKEGWTRAKLVEFFHNWLVSNGWEPRGEEEDGLGIDLLEFVDTQGFRHRRYHPKGDSSSGVSATLSVQKDNTSCGAPSGLWTVIVETVNDSWWTKLRGIFDD